MNYQIIVNEERFKEFIAWLPECSNGSQYYCCLFSRKKYSTQAGLTNDKIQLKRFTSTKERLFYKVKQLECEIGSYRTHKGESVPQESLALYITPNPRDLTKSSKEVAKELINRICEGSQTTNPKSLALDKIQIAVSDKTWFDFDLDSKGFSLEFLKEEVEKAVGTTPYTLVEGRGGYHILINLKAIDPNFKNSWYNNITRNEHFKEHLDLSGDLLLPVVGCTQGNFEPKLILCTTQSCQKG